MTIMTARTDHCEIFHSWVRDYIRIQWDDIHRTREQDWKLLQSPLMTLLVTLAAKLLEQSELRDVSSIAGITNTYIIFAFLSLFLSVVGLLVTLRHYRIFLARIAIIECLETCYSPLVKNTSIRELINYTDVYIYIKGKKVARISVQRTLQIGYVVLMSVSIYLLGDFYCVNSLGCNAKSLAATIMSASILVILLLRYLWNKWNIKVNKLTKNCIRNCIRIC